MGIIGRVLRRKRLEHVQHLHSYPEPFDATRHPRWAFWYRVLLGRPMDNVRWTDATFWRDATGGEASRWLRLAGWKRAAVRVLTPYLLAVAALIALLIFIGQERPALTIAVAHLALLTLTLTPIVLTRRVLAHGLTLTLPVRVTEQHDDEQLIKRWEWQRRAIVVGRLAWEREKVLPLARSLLTHFSLPRTRLHPSEVREWVSVPRNYREPGGAPVVIQISEHATLPTSDRTRAAIVKAAAERLGMKDAQAEWQLEGALPSLLLRAPVLPPKLVTPADVAAQLEAADMYTFVLGMSGSEVLTASLKDDSPHIALSAGSGAGKSEQIKGLIAHWLHHGGFVLILDWKGESQEWAEVPTLLPGVRYVRHLPQLHEAMVSIGDELELRRLMRRDEREQLCAKLMVVSEEWGVTAPLLSEYWTEQRQLAEPEERKTMPLRSPAISAGMKLNFCGRSLGMTQLLIAQRFSARVTNGNADLRESFGVKLLARYSPQTVKMLAPDIRPFPKKDNSPGRWVAVNGDVAVVYRGVLWTDEEAREWATSGQANPVSPWTTQAPVAASPRSEGVMGTQEDQLRPVATSHNGDAIALPAAPERKLRKLVDISTSLEYLGITHGMLKKAARSDAQGDSNFPPVRGGDQFAGYLYDVVEVKQWAKDKRAAEAAQKAVK